jgi:uncharacterized protein YndB with AHSA1/START domain
VTVSTVISAPREQVFGYLQDIANHAEFTDHYLVDWHLTREDSVGLGAGARFRVRAPGNRFSWGDSTFTEVSAPHRIVERGRTGKSNRIRTLGVYELSSAPGGATRVKFSIETEPRVLSDRRPRVVEAQERQGDAPPALDHRARRRPRTARHGSRRIDSRLAMTMTRKPALLALLALAALGLGACSDDSHTPVSTGTYAGESGQNAPYLNVGPLIYEVQLSRQLNPADTEDSAYLKGLTPAQRRLARGEEWFAVFLQVYNESSAPHPAATQLTISDTQANVYTPTIPAATNEFAYRAGLLQPKSRIPALNAVAANGPTQGALLLYKIKIVSLDNRPLELKIVDPLDLRQTAQAELDV